MMWLESLEISERVDRLDLRFDRYGLDPIGISRSHLYRFFSVLAWLYRHYFRVVTRGIQNVPDRGPAILVGNHSGGLPVDAVMVMTALLLEHEPPRMGHGMVDKFAQRWPYVSEWLSRTGQLPGLPENALRLLEQGRLLLVFPEGTAGSGKLYRDRYRLNRFGTGFLRLALRTGAPVVPFAFVGGEEALPVMFDFRLLARLTGAPYWPVPPHLLPLPLPWPCRIHFGRAIRFRGSADLPDRAIGRRVSRVRQAVQDLIEEGLQERRESA